MFLVRGALKDYDWGVIDGLAPWYQATGGPQAELWFGAHPSGPATILEGPGVGGRLDDGGDMLGLPLVKLLAASTPLSLQVHPAADRAEAGWRADQQRALEDRRYADRAEKREMIVALTPFDVHAGWRDARAASEVLERAMAPAAVVDAAARGDRVRAIRGLLDLPAAQCALIEPRLVAAATAAGWSSEAVSALARVAATHPGDPGVLISVLLDYIRLQPGDGLAVPAGVIHSYIDGLGVEVMTSSDNVLRLGLTSKPVAVEDALAALVTAREPTVLHGSTGRVLSPHSMPFDLLLAEDAVDLPSGRHRVVVALHGDAVLRCGDDRLHVTQGLAAIVWPGEGAATVTPAGTAIVVTGVAP